ncbi:MAG: hypothetical protein HFE30_01365, partial [Clostridiales bacterium]|nr:hypothetical protein [Clostridiales bacterium]
TPNFEHGKLNIRYIAAFKSEEEAEAYVPSEEHEDYFMNYRRPATLSYEKVTNEETERQDKLVREKIEEVMNAKSIITPESIEAAGYNCYYVSSEHGDDSNNGKTPETAWKTIRHLTEVSNDPFNGKVEPGDGVFFERGSVFYPERPTIDGELRGLMTIYAFEGVNYGAYGDESLPKPLFSGAMDFRDTPTGNGVWEKTEYPNIWKLDQSDKDMEYRRNDVGNIIFNEGEFIGVHIRSELKSEEREKISPFGEGKEMEYLGYQSNGKEEFLSGGAKNPENIGDVLKHNLEFFQDQYEGVLYLYWDGRENPGQNPADSFDSINVSRECHVALGQDATSFDNVAFKYSSAWLVSSSILGSQFTNCEFGFCGGGYLSVASGVEVSGERVSAYKYYLDNLEDYAAESKTHHLIENCYFHDIEDGPMSAQNAYSQGIGQASDPMRLKGIEYSNNVIVSCGNGAELFAGQTYLLDENGYMIDKIEDVYIHDNIMAYIGYGITQQQGDTSGGKTTADILCGGSANELVPDTCKFENNTLFKCRAQITSANVALDGQPRGWNLKGNTYILPDDVARVKNGFEDVLVIRHPRHKDNRMTMPYNERYLRYFNSLGFDTEGKFYHYKEDGIKEDRFVFFLTGYHVSRGIEPVITRVN